MSPSRWISVLRRRCFPAGEDGSRLSPPEKRALREFRSLGSRVLRPLSWQDAWERIERARLLLVGSWHPLCLQAEAAGRLAARLSRRGKKVVLALGMVPAPTLRRGGTPRGLPQAFLPSLFRGLGPGGRAGENPRVLGLGGLSPGPGRDSRLVKSLLRLVRRGNQVLLYQGELHLLPSFLPRSLKAFLAPGEIQVVWPGAPGPCLRLFGRGDPREPALLERGDLYLPLCHPLHRTASLRAWREKAPLLPPTRWMPWLSRRPGLEEAFRALARKTASLLGAGRPPSLPMVSFEEGDPAARLEELLPPGPSRAMAARALEEGEGLALPQVPLVVLGGPGAVEAAEEAAHLLHLTRTGLHRLAPASPLHALLLASLAEGVARAAARLALPSSPPWAPLQDHLPREARAWKRRAWSRLQAGRTDLPSPEALSPEEAGIAAHLLGYALAERLLRLSRPAARLARLAGESPPPTGEGTALLLREFLREGRR